MPARTVKGPISASLNGAFHRRGFPDGATYWTSRCASRGASVSSGSATISWLDLHYAFELMPWVEGVVGGAPQRGAEPAAIWGETLTPRAKSYWTREACSSRKRRRTVAIAWQ
jgi:hypothetical protein